MIAGEIAAVDPQVRNAVAPEVLDVGRAGHSRETGPGRFTRPYNVLGLFTVIRDRLVKPFSRNFNGIGAFEVL
jgi:hypothetical protein